MSLATALYSVVSAVLRPLQYPHSSELVSMSETIPEHDMSSVPPRLIEAVKADSRTMRDVVVLRPVYVKKIGRKNTSTKRPTDWRHASTNACSS